MSVLGRLIFVALLGILSMQAHAQYYRGDGQRFVCKSSGYNQNYCEADTRDGVRMTRQISNSACVLGRTWNYDRRGVWVAQGCEAEFVLGSGMGGGDRYGRRQVIRCDSQGYQQEYCRADTRGGVRLQRQISSSACLRGRSWGFDDGGVWVSDGCQGEFVVGGGWGDRGAPPPSVRVRERVVRCESINNRTVRCDVNTRGGVRVAQQLSSSGCYEGRSWGWDHRGIWVSGGCRADFQVGGYYQ